MKDIGTENYYLHEDIKALFDPNHILNPHLSVKKPETYLEDLSRRNKIVKYFRSFFGL